MIAPPERRDRNRAFKVASRRRNRRCHGAVAKARRRHSPDANPWETPSQGLKAMPTISRPSGTKAIPGLLPLTVCIGGSLYAHAVRLALPNLQPVQTHILQGRKFVMLQELNHRVEYSTGWLRRRLTAKNILQIGTIPSTPAAVQGGNGGPGLTFSNWPIRMIIGVFGKMFYRQFQRNR